MTTKAEKERMTRTLACLDREVVLLEDRYASITRQADALADADREIRSLLYRTRQAARSLAALISLQEGQPEEKEPFWISHAS